jgi:hypothetical protein
LPKFRNLPSFARRFPFTQSLRFLYYASDIGQHDAVLQSLEPTAVSDEGNENERFFDPFGGVLSFRRTSTGTRPGSDLGA